nr:MAG TPA: hypothetical protein [Caudoviricetes sp.]
MRSLIDVDISTAYPVPDESCSSLNSPRITLVKNFSISSCLAICSSSCSFKRLSMYSRILGFVKFS